MCVRARVRVYEMEPTDWDRNRGWSAAMYTHTASTSTCMHSHDVHIDVDRGLFVAFRQQVVDNLCHTRRRRRHVCLTF